MKNIFILSIVLLMAVSCSKQPLPAPVPNEPITISLFHAEAQGTGARVTFTATHDQDVSYYQVFSGADGNFLCVIGKLPKQRNDTVYTFRDRYPKGNPTYYMIAYRKKDSSLIFYGGIQKVTF